MKSRKISLSFSLLLLVGFLALIFQQKADEKSTSGKASPIAQTSSTPDVAESVPAPQKGKTASTLAIVEPPSNLRRGSNHRFLPQEAVVQKRTADPHIVSQEVIFQDPRDQDFGPLTINRDTISAIEVGVDFAAVKNFLASDAGTIAIPIAKDTEVLAHFDKVVTRGEFTTTLIGEVLDDSSSEIFLVFHDNAVSGIASFYDTNTHYQFGTAGNGSVAVRNLEPDSGGIECLNCQGHELAADLDDPSDGEATAAGTGQVAFSVPPGKSPYDVVVGYSAEGRINSGGTAAIEAAILTSVDRLNESLDDSGAGVWFASLVATIEDPDESFTDGDNIVTVIQALSNTGNGTLDAVTDLMNDLGADQAVFLLNDQIGNSNGVAQIGGRYAVVARTRLVNSRRTFSHETGHNLGFRHAWGQDGGANNNPLDIRRYGWRFVGSNGVRYRTIMAGDDGWNGSRVGHFSNPNVQFNGGATGAIDGFNATDGSPNPQYDQNLVEGGTSNVTLGAGYDGSNPDLGADNARYARETGGATLANRDTRTALALIEPGANAALSPDEPSTIFWYGGDHTDTVSLDLFKGGQFQSSIADNVSAHLRFFDWSIPAVPTGNDYQVRITLNGTTSANSANFAIIEPIGPLLADWSFDGVTSTSVPDDTGNGFDGTPTNVTSVEGLVGNALSFNGSSSSVTLPVTAFQTVGDEVTIAMWVFGADNQPRRDSVFYAVNGDGIRTLNVHLPWDTGEIFWDAGASGTRFDRINSVNTEPDAATQYEGRWNHWVFTKNADSGDMEVYHNGSLFNSGTGNNRTMAGITSAFIGSQTSAPSALSYSGMIDEVQLYNVSLDASEVSNLFESYTSTNGVPFAYLIENGFAPSEAVATGDSDNDGQTNDLEYYFGTDPNVRDSPISPISAENETFSFEYTRRIVDNMTVFAEWSSDLNATNWNTTGLTEVVTSVDGDIETVLVTSPMDDDRKFIRIRTESLQ